MNTRTADTLPIVSEQLAHDMARHIDHAITTHGNARIALSGGTTPALCMRVLSNADLDWSKVTITLSDERWVAANNNRSNHLLMRENMLINHAQSATFLPLYHNNSTPDQALAGLIKNIAPLQERFDLCLLGMGGDGHFASLFPDSPQLQHGLTTDEPLLAVHSPSMPEPRISMGLNLIASANNLALLIAGQEKIQLLQRAHQQHTPESTLPIAILIKTCPRMTIYQSAT